MHLSFSLYLFVVFEGLELYILNTEKFGFIVKAKTYKDFSHAVRSFLNFKLKTIGTVKIPNNFLLYLGMLVD